MRNIYNNENLKNRRKKLRRNQTDAEKFLWSKLRKRQMLGLRFFRQYSVGPYILDFYCPAIRLAIELDGGHHNEEHVIEYDERRSLYISKLNIEVIRFWNHDVINNVEGVVDTILQSINITPPNLPLDKGRDRKGKL